MLTTAPASFFNFAGVVAAHVGGTDARLAISFSYNGVGTPAASWSIFGGSQHDTHFTAFRNRWNHQMFVFLPQGRFMAYNNGMMLINTSFGRAFPSMISGSFFSAMYYNGMVDDFAIFEGDMGPHVDKFQSAPASQVFNATGVGAACIPCYAGMYCANNTATACPPDKMSVAGTASSITDCYCKATGMHGIGTANCSQPCPANSYCPGGNQPIQTCQMNTVSAPGSSQVSQCQCPSPFQWDINSRCTCMSPIQISNLSNPLQCQCAPGYYDHPQPYSFTPSTRPEANCGSANSPCKWSYLAGSQWDSLHAS
jgi:hypothetical protein